ncbi:metallophosphoesterase family protein [Paraburkholderia sp. LEh10]|uniref:purple acid phosphatase family protein n=1 Tax=Paraburkholderia sp. LEh10 TaxID=2821353 RepID=UPI001AEB7611|nr:metallophosphoesterase family protein [Paraburkholderia sp. LEh10]MBP0592214.1 metallophosphoesterase family protein [Paraburkholderia sp. LEh10]
MVTKTSQDSASLASRRGFLKLAGASGITTAANAISLSARAASSVRDGTPEQIHLTWGTDPASEIIVSWASLTQAIKPRVRLRTHEGLEHLVHAVQRTYTDGLSGEIVCTYHARLSDLRPDTTYQYEVTADNDSNASQPFSAMFRTAARGRHKFRFTSYGDLATPNVGWVLSSLQSRYAVQAVERFEPLFHLLNGDLCYANLNPTQQPEVWRDFGNNVQASATNRPWMPCPGNHEIEFNNGKQGFDSYLTRYMLPDNGTRFAGHWYSFRVSSVLFISLDADDVIYQDSAAFVAGPSALTPAASTGNSPIEPGTSFYVRGYSQGEQTRWLERTLREASRDGGVEWIVVQMHQDALSSSKTGNGSDKGIREAWLPLFDQYGVDLVLCGHDHDYERSHPVRGCNHYAGRDAATGDRVDTLQPRPVVTSHRANDPVDTSRGTVHLILGGGGTSAPLDVYGIDTGTGLPQAMVFTKPNRPVASATGGTFVRPAPDAVEDAIWSARRDTETGYGIAVFDVDPGERGGRTSITMNYYHAPGADQKATADYELFETIVFEKPCRD